MARVNSLPYFKAKLHPSQHKGGGAIRVKSKSIKAENAPTTWGQGRCLCPHLQNVFHLKFLPITKKELLKKHLSLFMPD